MTGVADLLQERSTLLAESAENLLSGNKENNSMPQQAGRISTDDTWKPETGLSKVVYALDLNTA